MISFNIVDERDEPKEVIFNSLSPIDKHFMLRDAYDEKRVHECPSHVWELQIDCGSVFLVCEKCEGDYSYIQNDYQEFLQLTAKTKSVDWIVEEDWHGEFTDQWLQVDL